MNQSTSVSARMHFLPTELAGGPIVYNDLREPGAPSVNLPVDVSVMDARCLEDKGIHSSGFELVNSPSAVKDFYDCDEVMATYYAECKALAKSLTGAHTTFTFDHVIREAGKQFSGGGTDGSFRESGVERGGGYIGSVHMDYTDRTTWHDYLSLHGQSVPQDADHVYALNFWRPLSATAHDNPLAICDARSVNVKDLLEVEVYGYGAQNYSWHEIGIETFSVSRSEQQRWYYYPEMTPDDVLVIKSYDSDGVIGTTCPHASFVHPNPQGVARRSIELRVLCFC